MTIRQETVDSIDHRPDELLVRAVIKDALRTWPGELLGHKDGDCDDCDARAVLMRTGLRRYRELSAAGRPDEADCAIKSSALGLLDPDA